MTALNNGNTQYLSIGIVLKPIIATFFFQRMNVSIFFVQYLVLYSMHDNYLIFCNTYYNTFILLQYLMLYIDILKYF